MVGNMRQNCLIALAIFGVLADAQFHNLSEGDQMALEVSGVMLPPKKLSRSITEHLAAIRKIYPDMEDIHHSPKWHAGEIILSTIEDNTIQNINASRYGPIKMSERLSPAGDPGSSSGSDRKSIYRLVFAKPYHPARLVERLRSELGIQDVEGNLIFGEGNDVSYHATAPTYQTYTFKMGWGDCAAGCIYKHYWEYTVAPSQETLTVRFEKEYGSDLKHKNLV